MASQMKPSHIIVADDYQSIADAIIAALSTGTPRRHLSGTGTTSTLVECMWIPWDHTNPFFWFPQKTLGVKCFPKNARKCQRGPLGSICQGSCIGGYPTFLRPLPSMCFQGPNKGVPLDIVCLTFPGIPGISLQTLLQICKGPCCPCHHFLFLVVHWASQSDWTS